MKKYTITTTEIPNKYHEDDEINEFLEWVRYTKLESDAVKNLQRLLDKHDIEREDTKWERFWKASAWGIFAIVYVLIIYLILN